MVLLFQTLEGHGNSCGRGHSVSSTRASVESALRIADGIDARDIIVAILGPYVVLEGFVHRKDDIARALQVAEDIAGKDCVRSRMLLR